MKIFNILENCHKLGKNRCKFVLIMKIRLNICMNEWMKSFILLSYTTFINENSNSQNVIKMLSRYFSIEMHELWISFQFEQCNTLLYLNGVQPCPPLADRAYWTILWECFKQVKLKNMCDKQILLKNILVKWLWIWRGSISFKRNRGRLESNWAVTSILYHRHGGSAVFDEHDTRLSMLHYF